MKNNYKCRFERELTAWIQGELSSDAADHISRHVMGCDVCRTEAERQRALLVRLATLPVVEPSHDLTEEIMARMERSTDARTSRMAWIPWFSAAAAVLALAIGLGLLRRPVPGWRVSPSSADARMSGEAVRQAVDWLKAAQTPSGSWTAGLGGAKQTYEVGLTALALLAFIETMPESVNNDTVQRGVDFLLAQQAEDGCLGPRCSATMYNHGLATWALMEIYAHQRAKRLEAPVRRSLAFICDAQKPSGGWSYMRSENEQENSSVTVWPLHALARAKALGWPGVDESLSKGMAWMASLVDSDGRVGYTRQNDFPYGHVTLTAAGAWLFKTAGAAGASVQMLARLNDQVDTAVAHRKKADLYRDYFLVRALETAAGSTSMRAMGAIRADVLAGQTAGGPYAGSWKPSDRWSQAGGRVYATALGALALVDRVRH